MNRNTMVQKILAKNITLPEELIGDEPIRGVYGFFSEQNEHCLYIGRGDDILKRIHAHLYGKREIPKRLIEKETEEGCNISVKILVTVDFGGVNYYRDLHELAYAEYHEIETYQQMGQCLDQKPEGSWMTLKYWKEHHEKKS